ncbi:uncharacterized protein RBU57_015291 isoform 1-T1 [Macrochelys suwanniensis]
MGFLPCLPPGTGPMPGSPGFKPCSACLKPMPTGDPHDSCLKCLGESHLPDKCRICKAFKPRTKKEWDFQLKQLLLEVSLSPISAPYCNLVPTAVASTASVAPERPSSSKEPRHRPTQAAIPQRRRSMSPMLRKHGPTPAPPPVLLRPRPIQDRPAKSSGPAPAPTTPVLQGLLSSVSLPKASAPTTPVPKGPLSSVTPVMPAPAPSTLVPQRLLSSGPPTPAPTPTTLVPKGPLSSVTPVMPAPAPSTQVPQRPLSSGPLAGAPVPTTPLPQGPLSSGTASSPVHAEVELTLPSTPDTFSAAGDLIAMTDPALHQSPAPTLKVVLSRDKPDTLRPVLHAEISQHLSRSPPRRHSQSRHRSPSRRQSYLRHLSRSTSRHGRRYYDSWYRSRSHSRLQRTSPDDRPRYCSPRRTRSRSGSRYRDSRRYRSRSRY